MNRLCLRGLLVQGLEHKLNLRHGSVVTLAETKFCDARVAALAIRNERRDFSEQHVRRVLVAQNTQHTATGVQVTALSEGDEALGKRTKALSLCLGCLDRLVREQGNREVSEQQAFMRRSTAEAGTLSWRRH